MKTEKLLKELQGISFVQLVNYYLEAKFGDHDLNSDYGEDSSFSGWLASLHGAYHTAADTYLSEEAVKMIYLIQEELNQKLKNK